VKEGGYFSRPFPPHHSSFIMTAHRLVAFLTRPNSPLFPNSRWRLVKNKTAKTKKTKEYLALGHPKYDRIADNKLIGCRTVFPLFREKW